MYCGPTSRMVAHLFEVGRPVPPETNPADFVLEVCNKDVARPEEVDAIVEAWVSHASAVEAPAASVLPSPHVQAPFARQVFQLVQKQHSINIA